MLPSKNETNHSGRVYSKRITLFPNCLLREVCGVLRLLYIFILMLFSQGLAAEDTVLSIDREVSGDIPAFFPNENDVAPTEGDFEIVDYVLMSSELGERWAVVTLENMSAGKRLFESEHIHALFANGKRRAPHEFTHSFKGKEVVSVTLQFGISKFPILEIYTRNER